MNGAVAIVGVVLSLGLPGGTAWWARARRHRAWRWAAGYCLVAAVLGLVAVGLYWHAWHQLTVWPCGPLTTAASPIPCPAEHAPYAAAAAVSVASVIIWGLAQAATLPSVWPRPAPR